MINLNGSLINNSSTILTAENRAFKYGDALFETLKVTDLKIHFLEDHYFRLMASMRMIRMEIPLNFTMEFFEEEILNTVKAVGLTTSRVRFTVFRNDGGLYAPKTNEISYLIHANELNSSIKQGYSLELFKDYYIFSGLLSTIKTTNKIVNVLAAIFAEENEYDNCVLLNEKKNIVEVLNGNIFLVFGTTIKTPAITEGCIKGIIRKKIIEVLSKNKEYTIEETEISPFELQKADEVFITNAIVGVQPVHFYKKMVYKSSVTEKINEWLNQLV
ncbi:aminotransferase class IV [Lutibacter sp.]|uniref:aminotransferase class IV n=1 Tax=Lutibacter sp. TaxID=1925666 RepID=UPI001A26D092|nr:aminotransferase class IV [Lutibacter sp.]MBI9041339.1 aminotransferase class IV [Lutibacter sp.]